MPHATTPKDAQDELDDDLIQRTLNDENVFGFAENFLDRELEPGEKADDAVDFGDLSDDDLADDEDTRPATQPNTDTTQTSKISTSIQETQASTLTENDAVNDFDDLFGDGLSGGEDEADTSMPLAQPEKKEVESPEVQSPVDLPETQESGLSLAPRSSSHEVEDEVLTREQQLQQELFAMSRAGIGHSDLIPHPPENEEELLASLWPKFQRDTIPKFMDLLPSKKVRYIGKLPPKQPKPLQVTKLNLEIAPDDEKSFKLSSAGSKRPYEDTERAGIVFIRGEIEVDKTSDGDYDAESDFENEPVAGISWQDMQILCGDWDVASNTDSAGSVEHMWEQDSFTEQEWPASKRQKPHHDTNSIPHPTSESLMESDLNLPASKKRRLEYLQPGVLDNSLKALMSLHDPENATAKIAEKIILDLNDPLLLIDEHAHNTNRGSSPTPREKGASGRDALLRNLNQKYNISNDEAYDLLKENHQHKVRGTLGNITIEHSLPAVRLQWPFYKTKLEKQEARSFHRPLLNAHLDGRVSFQKLRFVKRKALKGLDAKKIFEKSHNLSLNDNSTALLLEYSEEHPTMLSNLGMGNRVSNYYRRKTAEDNYRPKVDIGDVAVLLPQDKGPFSNFGHIDPGELTPTLHNGMFKAPIFAQDVKNTDFLVVRSATGLLGPKWYMRKIDHVRVVGQEFPSVDVPGPHSRKVTTASKNRLKMISYRLLRKNKNHRISVGDVTKHFIDTTDMQNRQKMKEFMQFDKDYKEWRMRPGEAVPDEEVVRTMVKPEDVCLLESMQVGQQHLQDAGFSKDDDNSEEDEAKEGQNIEQQLAPWCTSRNFLHATQGKAMLQLHGEGDPSGRGSAFSFIKTSMKGGFRAMGESVAEKIESKRNKEYGGHSYNVARQQQSYDESIRRIWEAQKQSLSTNVEDSDSEMEDEDMLENSDTAGDMNTPRSDARPLGNIRRLDDETASQSTRYSNRSQAGKILIITREVLDRNGQVMTQTEEIRNSRVIRQYMKRRHARETDGVQLSELKPTGDDEADKRDRQRLEKELARLQRNQERRFAREKQKGIIQGGGSSQDNAGSPEASGGAAATPKHAGTQRKCANCGKVGHIKTNKKLCPLLNGTMKPEEGFGGDSAFSASAPSF